MLLSELILSSKRLLLTAKKLLSPEISKKFLIDEFEVDVAFWAEQEVRRPFFFLLYWINVSNNQYSKL